MRRVFISYRRDDTVAWAARLRSELLKTVAEIEVFFDVSSNRIGDAYLDRCLDQARQADIAIALIGPQWAGGERSRRRIEDPDDLLRCELIAARQGGAKVVPVFVDGATWAAIGELPDELGWLSANHGAVLRPDQIERDIKELAEDIAESLGIPASGDAPMPQSAPNTYRIGQVIAAPGGHVQVYNNGSPS